MTDVLDAVSKARTDLQPVFDTVAGHARSPSAAAPVPRLFVREGDFPSWGGQTTGRLRSRRWSSLI